MRRETKIVFAPEKKINAWSMKKTSAGKEKRLVCFKKQPKRPQRKTRCQHLAQKSFRLRYFGADFKVTSIIRRRHCRFLKLAINVTARDFWANKGLFSSSPQNVH